jgi:hypothetical protein
MTPFGTWLTEIGLDSWRPALCPWPPRPSGDPPPMSQLSGQPAWRLADAPEQQRWLVDGLWSEQSVGIIGGEPKCCKSFPALDLAAAGVGLAELDVQVITTPSRVDKPGARFVINRLNVSDTAARGSGSRPSR